MSPAGQPVDQVNLLQKVGHVVLCLYLFLAYSRLAEQKFPSLHIPGLLFLALLLFLVVPGVLSSLLSHSIGRSYLAFNALLFLSVPFSFWRGGSVAFLLTYWWRMFPLFPLVLGLTLCLGEIVRVFKVIAAAIFVLALLAAAGQAEILGRIAMENSRFGDPNYIGMMALFGLPFWIFFALRPGASLTKRVVPLAAIVAMAYVAARTGSRGALVAAGVLLVYAFFRSSLNGKLILVLSAAAVAAIGLTALDRGIRDRYLTVFSTAEVQDRALNAAIGSAESRRYLLMRSIELTAAHPLFGVGVNMFQTAENGVAIEEGLRKGVWHVTHNMYTQVSSELGIPALFCFLAVLVGSWRSLSRVAKAASGHSSPRAPEIATLAFCLKLSLLSLIVTGAFLSIAYDDLLAVLPALIVALERIAQHEGLFAPAPDSALAAVVAPGRSRAVRNFARAGA